MDLTKSFVTFLKDILTNEVKKYEASLKNGVPLLSVSYETIAEAKRLSGIRDTFVGVNDSLDALVKDFYDQREKILTSSSFTDVGE